MRFIIAFAVLLLAACNAAPTAQHTPEPTPGVAAATAAAQAHLAANEQAIVQELRDLLALPNVASNPADIRVNAEALVAMFARRGIAARILETPGAPVSVYAELATPGATRTLLFYAHFDGQSVELLDAWLTPPFEPTLRAGLAEQNAAIIP